MLQIGKKADDQITSINPNIYRYVCINIKFHIFITRSQFSGSSFFNF